MRTHAAILILIVGLFACKSEIKKTDEDFNTEIAKAIIDTAWNETYSEILKQIKPPVFKTDTLVVDAKDDFQNSLNQSIKILSKRGGGVVHIPNGIYQVKGPILMENNINLNLAENTTLIFSNDPNDFLPVVKTRWEGTFVLNYSPLIYAMNKENIAITGKGKIDGNCEEIWASWKHKQKTDKKSIRKMGNDQIPIEKRVFGDGHYLRPSGIEFIECKNILLEDFTIHHTPFWTIHPVLSENITIRGLNINKGTHNDDGIDPEHSKNVLIEYCTINTHDDCISIKAGRDQDGWKYPPSENIIVRHNDLTTEVGSGFCIGSEMSGGVQTIFFHDNVINGSKKHAFQFKSNPDRGGFVKNIFMRNIKVTDSVKYGFEFTTNYKGWRGNSHFVEYSDFYFQNIEMATASDISIKIVGKKEKPIHRIYLENIEIKDSKAAFTTQYTDQVVMENVTINGQQIRSKATEQRTKTDN